MALHLYTFSDDADVTDPRLRGKRVTPGVVMPRDLLRATVLPPHLQVRYVAWPPGACPSGAVETMRDTAEALELAEEVAGPRGWKARTTGA